MRARAVAFLACSGAVRDGTVQVLNAPGSGFAEAPGLAALLPILCQRLLGEDLHLASGRIPLAGRS